MDGSQKERGNFLNWLQKEGGTQKAGGRAPSEKGGGGGSNPWGNYDRIPSYSQGYIFKKQKEEPGMQILGKFNLVYSGHIVMKTLNTLHSII